MKILEKIDFYTPEFLLCEIPVKKGNFHDNRVWVYAVNAASLIEFICIDDRVKDFGFTVDLERVERFEYINLNGIVEDYFGVFTQDNCELSKKNSKEVMQAAWNFYKEYLNWENENIKRDKEEI